jgi:hypothetical protein
MNGSNKRNEELLAKGASFSRSQALSQVSQHSLKSGKSSCLGAGEPGPSHFPGVNKIARVCFQSRLVRSRLGNKAKAFGLVDVVPRRPSLRIGLHPSTLPI